MGPLWLFLTIHQFLSPCKLWQYPSTSWHQEELTGPQRRPGPTAFTSQFGEKPYYIVETVELYPTPGTSEDDTATRFYLLFRLQSPEGQGPADNSDNLILTKAFQAGN